MREHVGFSRAEEPGVFEGWSPTPGSVLLQDTGDTGPRAAETGSDDDLFALDSEEGFASW